MDSRDRRIRLSDSFFFSGKGIFINDVENLEVVGKIGILDDT